MQVKNIKCITIDQTKRVVVTRGIIQLDMMFCGKKEKLHLEYYENDIIVNAEDEFELSESNSEENFEKEDISSAFKVCRGMKMISYQFILESVYI